MKVLYLGGRTAGLVGLLTLLARGYRPDVISYSEDLSQLVEHYSLFWGDIEFRYDLVVSVHGRWIVPSWFLNTLTMGGINLHPMLSKFPGKNPIRRALDNGETKFSVGAHRMTDVVDGGEILVEKWIDLPRANELAYTEAEIYANLMPLYSIVLNEALDIVLNG